MSTFLEIATEIDKKKLLIADASTEYEAAVADAMKKQDALSKLDTELKNLKLQMQEMLGPTKPERADRTEPSDLKELFMKGQKSRMEWKP